MSHALVGRNGAGKSTLVAILTGLYRAIILIALMLARVTTGQAQD